MSLAETKRQFNLNENYIQPSGGPVGSDVGDIFIVNPFGFLGQGFSDEQFIGNQILDPMVVLKLSIQINWGAAISYTAFVPTISVTAMLIAVNDQYGATTVPRVTTIVEDAQLFLVRPGTRMKFMINGQAVTVIKRKRMTFSPRNVSGIGTSSMLETRKMKLAKRLRGKKTYETTFDNTGLQQQIPFLKGYNFYWLVVSEINALTSQIFPSNPVNIVGDRFLYFKDV